jgi:hypothetical protein
MDATMEEAKTALKTACTSLSQCRKEAQVNRQTFLDEKIEAAAQAEDTTTEKLLKKLRHREAQSTCFSKLSYALKPAGNKGGVTSKVELVIDGETIAYTEKQDVERETKQSNKRHFNTAAGTPFTLFPLSDKHSCPSGLRGSTQVRVYSYAWVQIPLNAAYLLYYFCILMNACMVLHFSSKAAPFDTLDTRTIPLYPHVTILSAVGLNCDCRKLF